MQYTFEPGVKIIRFSEVCRVTGLSRSTIERLRSKGKFPTPLLLGGRAIGWPDSAIYDWLNQRISKNYVARHQP